MLVEQHHRLPHALENVVPGGNLPRAGLLRGVDLQRGREMGAQAVQECDLVRAQRLTSRTSKRTGHDDRRFVVDQRARSCNGRRAE
ncbi:MAG: hypothetical protein R3E68_02295 [Burkholderiaceae bacterium]